ncbi:MAG: bifunctional diaminohydroxyphosphoribosylaminopyrimidine deaminase/5-amino-6-(5-phosphoribosylamino)uracil reductase RibD [Halomonadaceae bacterium]|nr:MAG: bifunctional diaminohydroxyphosphoribosylaminopyrimidine deaminase/5-amino-6-(5-phosphoribosylamino)uracil reductase RibD [Halomonadaceae bacterium]
MHSADDQQWMARALQLAERGLYSTRPNPRVGAVIVANGQLLGEGWHQRAGEAHAEVLALAQAGAGARGATAYVTLEPCSHHGRTPPCADALIEAGVARVVVAVKDANPSVAGRGLARLQKAGIATEVGVLEGPARALNAGFLRVMAGGRPWLRLKMAASLDGRTAMASGESQWITGEAARADVQRLRARSGAIITGAGTVRADNPSLTVRSAQLGDTGAMAAPVNQPLRLVLDPRLTVTPDCRLVTGPGRCVIAGLSGQGAAADALRSAGAEVLALPASAGGLDVAAALEWLAKQQCHEVLLEAGPTLAGAAIEAGLVDELWLYQAPTFLGSRGRPMAVLNFDRMSQQQRWQITDRRQVGNDQRLILRPLNGA